MIRVIQRRLIIPRGDTGIFTIPAMTQAEGAIGVFTIFDPITNTRIFQKQVEIEGENFNISFSHADTVNLKAGEYLWDIKFYKNPILADNKVIDGEEINSYYAAFQAPKCEIRETGDDFLMIEGQPAKIEDLNIILAATEAANAAKVAAIEQADIAATKAEEAAAKLEEMKAAIPTKVSELENDSGYLQEETDPTVPAWAKTQTKPSYTPQEVGALPADTFIPSKVSDLTDDSGHYTKPASGIPASDLEETYLTAHQDISMKANSADLAAVATSGSYNDLENKPFIPSKVSDLTDDSGHYTKPAGGIPASDLAEEYLTAHQDISGKANKSEIPTKVSQLQNDSGYLTSFTETDPTVPEWAKAAQKPSYTAAEVGAPTVQEMNSAISTAIGNVNSFDMAVVQTLPEQDISTHTIYLVPKTGETNDVYDEYVYINDAWEMVGNTQIDLSNYVQKTDYATNNTAGIVKTNGIFGTQMISQLNTLGISRATDEGIKVGTDSYKPITPVAQHISTFYGLAKAAGDTTQSQSDNAVGTYTDEAKAAIQTMLDVPSTSDVSIYATKADTVLETTLSRGRKADIPVGEASFAFGYNVAAQGYYSHAEGSATNAYGMASHAEGSLVQSIGINSHAEGNSTNSIGDFSHAEGRITTSSGNCSHAEGYNTTASGHYSHAEGLNTVASLHGSHAEGGGTVAIAALQHVEGKYNVIDNYNYWSEWIANTAYEVGDKVKVTTTTDNETVVTGYKCKTANTDSTFTAANWSKDASYNYAHIVGNGSTSSARANIYALDWSGNGHYMGDVYVGANADSSGGERLAKESELGLKVVRLI